MSSDPLTLVLSVYLLMVVVMAVLWVLQLRVRNASIADLGWCAGLLTAVVWYAGQATGENERKILLVLMAAVYTGRLGLFILFNRVLGQEEDFRYQSLRMRWGTGDSLGMFGYFQLQAVAVAVFSLPFLAVMENPRPPFALPELIGVLIWVIAIWGEAAADRQLARFRAKPWNRDRVCRDGLWGCSRHPNYFFEWVQWWTYVVMGVAIPGWPLTWLGPIVMGYALLYVTGIPPAEEQALAHRGEEYRQYQRTTNAFLPWFPRNSRPTGPD